jgi:hypothetical protein
MSRGWKCVRRRSVPLATATICGAIIGVWLSWASPTRAAGRFIYASPGGTAGGDGSPARPYDLATALGRTSPARAGDVIWLRGGVYRGAFKSYIAGTASNAITVRQHPNERATLDSAGSLEPALTVFGGGTTFWGFEIMNSDGQRVSAQSGSWPTDIGRGAGATAHAAYVRFINLVVHDLAGGLGFDGTASQNGEAYGNIIYYNGWQAPDRAHGHGLYMQNRVGRLLVRDNIVFNQFSHGIHAYGSASAYLDNITLSGNVAFNNGILGRAGFERDILVGGGRVAQGLLVKRNATYGGAQTNLGYSAGCAGARVRGNYLVGGNPLVLVNCAGLVQNNKLYGPYGYGTLPAQYPNNRYMTARPTATVVRVRPNQYEPGRAHVVIYNWPLATHVAVSLEKTGLRPGDRFEVRDAQDFFGPAVLGGVYDGRPILVPMIGHTAERPVGNVPRVPGHTAPEFAAFVVIKR